MKKIYLIPLIIVVIGVVILGMGRSKMSALPHDGTYLVNAEKITLKNGVSEMEVAPGSSSKIITRYWGGDVKGDFDNDGNQDLAFLITQETGGSGTFYYAVALLNKSNVKIGTEAVLIGDRIAPQNMELKGKDVLIVNYADRNAGESFVVSPSVGKSLYLKLDPSTLQFGEVVQNFEGESAASLTEPEARKIAENSCIKGGEALAAGIHDKNTQTWSFDANLNATREGCTSACVVSETTKTAEIKWSCATEPQPTACTDDAKQCPDGSYVGRSGPNCKFVCPK